jgi:hypothetical protein
MHNFIAPFLQKKHLECIMIKISPLGTSSNHINYFLIPHCHAASAAPRTTKYGKLILINLMVIATLIKFGAYLPLLMDGNGSLGGTSFPRNLLNGSQPSRE